MNETNFFYWLQGHFELGAKHTFVDRAQAECIIRHATLVAAPGERLIEVRTLARLLQRDIDVDRAGELTDEMRRVVGEQFLHVIDPQAGGPEVQAALNAAHARDQKLADLYANNPHLDPNKKWPSGMQPRC